MKILVTRTALSVLAALVVSACAGETDAGSDEAAAPAAAPVVGGAPALTPEQQQQQMQMIAELQSIDQQLGPLQDQALADPVMVAKQDELVATVEEAMEDAAPGSKAKREEFDTLLNEYNAAQGSGDQAKMAELTPRLQALDTELGQAQGAAMEREEIREAVEAFQDDLAAKMRELDDGVGSLLDRREELTGELEQMMEGLSGQ
ncbi:MAG: hypothetical protein OEU54_11500 [Gemmatimonadota bacterium]|nr:hypothetical protein [Gemmatimonadota bacterium]